MRAYNAEIISVGTELLLGHITNTDARDISEALAVIGINVLYHTVVGDNPVRLKQCIETAKERVDIIITTGGLGPTCDDLTKEILAEAFGVEMKRNEDEFGNLYDYITARHEYTENNTKQAFLPAGCVIFHNTCGTAPGCAFEKDGKYVLMLPGPPKECRTMLKLSAVPYLQKLSEETIVSHTVRIFGIGESGVDALFAEEMNRMTNPSLAPYAKEADCLLKVTAKAGTAGEAEAMCQPVIEHIRGRLGDFVYGVDTENLEQCAASLLLESGKTLAVAEGFSGGELSGRFSVLSGAKTFFKGGVAAFSDEAKSALLGLDPDVILTEGSVSDEVTAEMAEEVRRRMNADYGIAMTGLTEQEEGSALKAGTVFIALATGNETFVKFSELGTARSAGFVRLMAGNIACDMLRRFLTGLSVL